MSSSNWKCNNCGHKYVKYSAATRSNVCEKCLAPWWIKTPQSHPESFANRLTEAESELEAANARVKELEEELEAATAKIKKSEQFWANRENQHNITLHERNELQKRVGELEELNEQLCCEIQGLTDQLQCKEITNNSLHDELNDLRGENAELREGRRPDRIQMAWQLVCGAAARAYPMAYSDALSRVDEFLKIAKENTI